MTVIHCGVDTSRFRPEERDDRSQQLEIVCVGTLHEVKGQAYLLDACRALVDSGRDVHCSLVGDGPDRAMLERRIADAGVANRVSITGGLTQDDVAALLRDADVLVAPSVPTAGGKREGIPVVLMEALSSGIPAVASDLSGIPELIEDGITGLLVKPRDATRLADALARLADDPGPARRLGLAGRDKVVREFDLDTNAGVLVGRFARRRCT